MQNHKIPKGILVKNSLFLRTNQNKRSKMQQDNQLPIRGAIFDMDGTLVDNSAVHTRTFALFCARYGIQDWQQRIDGFFGMGNEEIMRRLFPEEVIRRRGVEELGREKEALYREIYAPEIQPVTGLVHLLDLLQKAGIRCAVGSSGCRENVEFVLEKCHIAPYFEVCVSGDMVTRCKPDPEIYLTAAEKLGLTPAECIVFEDARAGFEAARRAGAGRLVAIATTLSRSTLEEEHLADCVVADFAEIHSLQQLL